MTIRTLAALGLLSCSLSACIMLPPPHHGGSPRPFNACGEAPPDGPRHAGPPPRGDEQMPACEAPQGPGWRGERFAPGAGDRLPPR